MPEAATARLYNKRRFDIELAAAIKNSMSRYMFRTNIDCIGCATQIKLHLYKLEQNRKIDHWQVHLNDPEHTLEVETLQLGEDEVRTYVQDTGFTAELKLCWCVIRK
jgi:hypothetical protein